MKLEYHAVTVSGDGHFDTFNVYANRRGARGVAQAFVEARLFGAGFDPEDQIEVFVDDDRVFTGSTGDFVGQSALERVVRVFKEVL